MAPGVVVSSVYVACAVFSSAQKRRNGSGAHPCSVFERSGGSGARLGSVFERPSGAGAGLCSGLERPSGAGARQGSVCERPSGSGAPVQCFRAPQRPLRACAAFSSARPPCRAWFSRP